MILLEFAVWNVAFRLAIYRSMPLQYMWVYFMVGVEWARHYTYSIAWVKYESDLEDNRPGHLLTYWHDSSWRDGVKIYSHGRLVPKDP